MSGSLAERKAAAYAKLEEVVNELSALIDEEEEATEHSIPTAWVLCVGYDTIDSEDGGDAGQVVLFPRNGSQAAWKTGGVLRQVLSRIAR